MIMHRLASSFKNRGKPSSAPTPPHSSPPEYDPNVYSDEEWSDNEFDQVEYDLDLYADPNTTPPLRLNVAPPLPPTMSPTLQRRGARPLPPPPTQALQDDNGEGLYMGPADAYRGLGRVDHTPPRPPNNQINGIMPRSYAPQTIGLVEDEGIYMGPGDAAPQTRGMHHAPPVPPSRQAPRASNNEQGTTENDSISGIFRFLDAETCSSIVTPDDDKEDVYEVIDAVEGSRSNRPSPGFVLPGTTASIPNLQEARNALRKPHTAPKPTGGFHGFPVAKPRVPPQTAPKPSHVMGMPGFGRGPSGGVESHGVVTGSGYIPSGNDITDPVRNRILAGAKRLPTLPVNNMPKLKSPEISRRNVFPSTAQQGDFSRAIPPTPPPQARKPPWAIHRQIKTPPVEAFPPQPPPSLSRQWQPQTPPEDQMDLYHYHWYHGTIDRPNVNERLYSINVHGAYLVRKSSRGGDTLPYALSVLFNDKIWNLHIRQRHDNTYALGTAKPGEMSFNSIAQLVEYHKTTVLILSGSFGGETTLTESPRRLQ